MLRYLYTIIYYLCAPLLCIRWVYKSFKPPQYREPMRERFGFVAKQKSESVWFHAVSMGESIAAKTIITELLKQQPHLNIVVTTTTPTGARQIIEGLGDKVTHHFSPCDLPGTIKRFVRRIKPKALIIMETELWPNWLHHMRKENIPVVLANARMSQKSADKYLKIKSLSTSMMQSFSKVLAVGEHDCERFIKLGVSPENCQTTGNIKFDQEFQLNGANGYFPPWSSHQEAVWLAASTHKGEDQLLLEAHRFVIDAFPQAKLIIVPRHPERFDDVARMIEGNGFSYARRSDAESWESSVDVLLGDTMGELMLAYELAGVAFVAGSLVPVGGHNMIEPAVLGKPIISGPHVHNFQEIFRELEEGGGAFKAGTARQISDIVIELFKNEAYREKVGNQAKAVVEKSRGALKRTVKALVPFL